MPNFLKAEIEIITRLKNELSPKLIYHSYFHTLDVMNAAMQIANTEDIGQEEICLLRVAIAYHDSGFIDVYNGHEMKGCEYVRNDLPKLGFSLEQIEIICGMIMATKIPNQTNTILEKIIADADLDYLGRYNYKHIAGKLYEEFKLYSIIKDLESWKTLQENFIRAHRFSTKFSNENREHLKQENLRLVREHDD